MLVIGLTGGIGSGKSTVADLFAEKGITVIDTDHIARTLTQPGTSCFKAITDHWNSDDVLLPNGALNRSKLRKIIFANNNERIWLEQLLHPLIRKEVEHCIQQATSTYCIVVIPLLLESAPNPLIDRILLVDATEQQQRERASERDQLSQENIQMIIQKQAKREVRLAAANDIIDNSGTLGDLIPQVEHFHQMYLEMAEQE